MKSSGWAACAVVVAAFATALVPLTSASAAAPPSEVTVANAGTYCEGSAVRRCIDMRWNDRNNPDIAFAYAWIEDADGGANYDVAVTNIRVQEYVNDWSTRTWTINNDYDGWYFVSDYGRSHNFDCSEKWRYVRARALFKWKPHGWSSYSSKWINSYGYWCDGYSNG